MKELAKALAAFHNEIGHPPRDKVNPFFKSKYTDLNTLINYCKPYLEKHGLFVQQGFAFADDKALMTTAIYHGDSGECMENVLPVKLPDDPQKAGAVITYYRRYLYQTVCGVNGEEDDDGNAASGAQKGKKPAASKDRASGGTPPPPATDDDKATEKQVGKLNAMITEYGLERAEVKAMLKVTSLKDLTKARASKLFDGWDSFIDLYNKRTGAGDE